ncbi:MAG: hypothetical protein ABIG69_02540, partial [Bacteroidota bacterium]
IDFCGLDSSFDLTASLDGYQTKTILDINIPCWQSIELNIELEPESGIDPVIIAPGIMGSWEKTLEGYKSTKKCSYVKHSKICKFASKKC